MKEIIVEPNGRVRVRTVNTLDSRTQQQFKDECDINNIIKKYTQTGEITHLARSKGVYADVSEITDYNDAVLKVMKADAAFMTLDASIRARFSNDPAQFLAFMQDPKNYDEGVKLGLFNRKSDAELDAAQHDELNDVIKGKSKKATTTNSPKTPSTPPAEE